MFRKGRQEQVSFSENKGFSLFELVIVILIISILIYSGSGIFLRNINDSKITVTNFQANTFARMVENLHAAYLAKGGDSLTVDGGVTVRFSETGWPASTYINHSSHSSNQTAEECESLWLNLFQKARNVDEITPNTGENFKVVLKNNYICRYILVQGQEESYFFDYDVRTGAVTWQTSSPVEG